MKPLRLLAIAIAATAWLATAAFAGDGAKSASNSSCCGTKASATKSASASCGAHATTAAATAKNAGCAASGNCPMSAEACKAAMASGACSAEMQAACAAKGAKAAAASGCTMHSTAAHADCAVCADEMACDEDVQATGAHSQLVSLRNGTMIVYTIDGAENVRGLQAAVARYNERVIAALTGDAKLCSACKKLRGALASGKLVREVVNVERGCQVIITSSDRSIVQQVHSCANAQVAARTRS